MPIPTSPLPHRRFNALTGNWVLVSAHRTDRPWRGGAEGLDIPKPPPHDPSCHLCPRVERATGERNPDYSGPFVFTNDYPALVPDVETGSLEGGALFRAEVEAGTCRVICFSPRHDLSLSRMDDSQLGSVVDVWADEAESLGRRFRSVQVFENRGEAMGASNPHPHGQIWAGSAVPAIHEAEDDRQRHYYESHGRQLLGDYLEAEATDGARVVVDDPEWLVVVPYWAVWPFEALVVPRRPFARLPDLDGAAKQGLASALRRLLVRYDNLFEYPFPYSMGWHGAPFDDEPADHWRLHAHFYPPLLLSASMRKFMVGYELTAEPQRDLTAEDAAKRLRELPEVHYRSGHFADAG